MKRFLLTVAVVFGLASGAWAGYGGSGGMMAMGLARVDAGGQLHLQVPSGSRPFEQTVQVGTPPETIKVVRTNSFEAGLQIAARHVEAIDADGKAISTRDLAKLLEKEAPVVVYESGTKPEAKELKMFKKGTIILILPVPLYGGYYGTGAID
jgi:hypothetical protein